MNEDMMSKHYKDIVAEWNRLHAEISTLRRLVRAQDLAFFARAAAIDVARYSRTTGAKHAAAIDAAHADYRAAMSAAHAEFVAATDEAKGNSR